MATYTSLHRFERALRAGLHANAIITNALVLVQTLAEREAELNPVWDAADSWGWKQPPCTAYDASVIFRIMEIESAARQAFDGLTLQEKSLAQELVRFEHYDPETCNAYYRAPVLYMDKVLAKLAETATLSKSEPRRINLYCDTLMLSGTLVFQKPDRFYCNIVARQILFATEEIVDPAIRMSLHPRSRLALYTKNLPSPFNVVFEGEGMSDGPRAVNIPPDVFGVEFVSDQGILKETVRQNPPEIELEYVNWTHLINEDGTLKGVPFESDNFPRLLNFQYLMAATQIYINPELAMSLLNWICATTSSKAGSLLNSQAQSLRLSLAAQTSGTPVSSVPSLNIYSCKQILKSRLLAAQSFEETFLGHLSSERSATDWTYLGADLLRKSDNALEEYSFLSMLANKRYDEAFEAHKYAEAQFQKTRVTVDEASAKFKLDIIAWEKKQKWAAAKDILFAAVSVGVAIAATVATLGAAAPALAVTVVDTGKTVSKIAQAIAKIKELVGKIKVLYEKLKPIIEKLGVLLESTKKMIDAIRTAESAIDALQALQQGDMKLDALNAIAQWSIFDIQIGLLSKQFQDLGIPDQDSYLFALRSLVVHGKTFLEAQVNLVERGDELATVLLRLKLQKVAHPPLEAMMKHFTTDTRVVAVLKTAMFDRLMTIRALVFVDFNSYVNAYMYHSLAPHTPVLLSAVKPIGDYFADAARLQGAVSQFGSTELIQRKSFLFNHASLNLDVAHVATRLKEQGKFDFSVAPSNEAFSGLFRVRLARVRVHLRGIKATSGSRPLRLAVQTSGRFVDIPEPGNETISDTRAFIGDARTVLFEKEIDGAEERITCDGDYGLSKDYTMQTPFTDWTVEIARGGLKLEEFDVQGLSGVDIELLCDFSYIDYR